MRGASVVELSISVSGRAKKLVWLIGAVLRGWQRKPMQIGMMSLVVAVIASSSAAAPLSAPYSGALPGTKQDQKFEDYLSGLDLEDGDRYQFHSKTGGTSIGFKISRPGKRKKAMFLASNTATILEGEVVSYRLSRLLGVSKLYNPVDYYELGPKAIARFRSMLSTREANKWRRFNTRNLAASMARQPKRLLGIVKYRHKRRSQPVEQLSNGAGRLNRKHILARYLRATAAQPPGRKLRLAGVGPDKKKFPHPSASAAALARQLSIIFVVDMLTEQWDRFSGGNIEVYALKSGRLRFVARDNGGAGLENEWQWYRRYLAWVTRYDRGFVQQLTALNAFLQGRSGSFGGYVSGVKLKTALGFRRDSSFQSFKRKLRRFAERDVPALESRYAQQVYFAPPDDSVAGNDKAPGGSAGRIATAAEKSADKPLPSGQLRIAAAKIAGAEPVWIDVAKPRRKARQARRSKRSQRARRTARARKRPEPRREQDDDWQKRILEDL